MAWVIACFALVCEVGTIHQSASASPAARAEAEERNRSADFVSAEEKKTEAVHPRDTSVSPPLNAKLAFSCAHTASTRRTSLDKEDTV